MIAYGNNSPQAMARIVAMMIVTDGHIDDREIDLMDRLDVYAMLGLTRSDFMAVARAYCHTLVSEAEEHGSTLALDPTRVDKAMSEVTEPGKRTLVAKLLIAVMAADHRARLSEEALLDHVLSGWALERTDVVAALVAQT
jgi:hypothetical protein